MTQPTLPHILIVEDEVPLAELLADYLAAAGFRATCQVNGKVALEMIRKQPPDLILLDIMLPGMDGLAVCRAVREFSTVPIIMVTARVEELDRILGMEIGADDYVCKPFSPREVVARVKATLRRIAFDRSGSAVAALLQDDESSQRILASGQPLDLTPTEYRLLSRMMARSGQVFSRGQLLDLVTTGREEAFDRAIDSHIKNIRRKLAIALPDKELIHSVYGVGYRYEP